MRPDPDSDLAGEQSEYGDDTGFAAEATREPDADRDRADSAGLTAEATREPDADRDRADSAGLTAEDDHLGDGAD